MKHYKPLSQKQIEEIATNFLLSHDKRDGGRFMAEEVLASMGIDLLPVKGLAPKCKVEAYLAKKPNLIIVDKDLMDSGSARYLFTLTEEIAHTLLHIKKGKNIETLYGEIRAMMHRQYNDMERDAKRLAGAILMPGLEFARRYREHYDSHIRRMGKNGDSVTSARYTLRRLYMGLP